MKVGPWQTDHWLWKPVETCNVPGRGHGIRLRRLLCDKKVTSAQELAGGHKWWTSCQAPGGGLSSLAIPGDPKCSFCSCGSKDSHVKEVQDAMAKDSKTTQKMGGKDLLLQL